MSLCLKPSRLREWLHCCAQRVTCMHRGLHKLSMHFRNLAGNDTLSQATLSQRSAHLA